MDSTTVNLDVPSCPPLIFWPSLLACVALGLLDGFGTTKIESQAERIVHRCVGRPNWLPWKGCIQGIVEADTALRRWFGSKAGIYDGKLESQIRYWQDKIGYKIHGAVAWVRLGKRDKHFWRRLRFRTGMIPIGANLIIRTSEFEIIHEIDREGNSAQIF